MTQSLRIYPDTWEERKNVTKDLPDSLKNEMDDIILFGKFGISKWGVDTANQQLIIYAYNIQDKKEIDMLQNKKIGNWTIYVIHDSEIEDEIKEVYAELKRIENSSDLHVAGVEMMPADKKIIMHVSTLTHDNEKLSNTTLKGWGVEVVLAGRLKPTITNSTNQSY
ncbi:hypothetical protein Metfor_0893 [Methanoregula formicica SMSP]|uniref:Uncharacterized protein n=2 Tax=Methanoregula formicica TaxID=882104 RepID=L0HFT3_METFS|nr:hypothetical protein Metfor_0893 [Methanoregula formicica SMSP]